MKKRTITNLRNALNGRLYVYLSSEKIERRFLQDAENEGYLFGAITPSHSHCSNIIAVENGKQLSYVGFVGRMAFHNPSAVHGDFHRVDYDKFISGDEDFIFSE